MTWLTAIPPLPRYEGIYVTTQEITVVTGQRACRDCGSRNQAYNEYCHRCGAPLGNVPEIVHDPSAAAQSRATWRVYGVETELVGRSRELEKLVDTFRNVVDEERVATVLLVGEEGVGKSRLVDEFSQRVHTEFGDALLVSGAWAEGSPRPYAIIDRILRNRYYIPSSLSEDEARDRLLEAIKAIVKTSGAIEIAHRIGALIELPFPDSPFSKHESAQESTEAAWRALANLVRIDASQNPMVLVLEDLQFATPEALELIPFMAQSLTGAPLLCLVTTTPEFAATRNKFFEPISNFHKIPLKELADSEIRSLVSQVLCRAPEIPELVFERICSNSKGNPLIAEEILRILMAEGAVDTSDSDWIIHADRVADTNLPIGLSDIVEAGLQRLTDEERRLLEWAAVVGETFWAGSLFVVNNGTLDVGHDEFLWSPEERPEDNIFKVLETACGKDIILRHEDSLFADETEYSFKHVATRRLLLESLAPSESARLNGLVATWYEVNREKGIRGLDANVAEHHERAGRRQRAAEAYLRAAGTARTSHFNKRAVGLLLKALDLLSDDRLLQRVGALHDVGSLYDLMAEYRKAVPYLEEMARWSWRIGSPSKGGAAHNKLGRVYRDLGELDRALEHFDLSIHLFRRANDHVGVASSLDDIGKVHWLKGNYRAAEEHYTEGLAHRRELGEPRSLALSLNNMGSLSLVQGKFREALRHFRESLSLRREIGDQRGEGHSLNNLGVILAERGDLDAAVRVWSEALAVAQEIGDRALEGMLQSNQSEIERQRGNLDKSERLLKAATEICEECAHRHLQFEVSKNSGLLEMQRQDAKKALSHIEAALSVSREVSSPVMEGIALTALARVHASTLVGTDDDDGNVNQAEQAFNKAIEILTEVGNDAELGRASLAYGLFLLEQGLLVQAKKRLDAAMEIFKRLGMKRLIEETETYLAQL